MIFCLLIAYFIFDFRRVYFFHLFVICCDLTFRFTVLSPRTYNTVTNRGFVKWPRGVMVRSKAINYLVVAIVKRLDENSRCRPVESVYTHLSWDTQGPVTSWLELADLPQVGQSSYDVIHTRLAVVGPILCPY